MTFKVLLFKIMRGDVSLPLLKEFFWRLIQLFIRLVMEPRRLIFSAWYSFLLTGRPYPFTIRFLGNHTRLRLKRSFAAKVVCKGQIVVGDWFGNDAPSVLEIDSGATLIVENRFSIGPGVRIIVSRGAVLEIKGQQNESDSGITENGKIMVMKYISIGYDFIGSWNLFLTDSDHHGYGTDIPIVIPVIIGNHVWVGPNCSILKGSNIGDNCVVMNGCVIQSFETGPGQLIGGAPARCIKPALRWKR